MAKLNQSMQDLMRYNAAILPQKRSVFSKNHSHCTTIDSAYLVPVMWDRVLPGDEKKIRYSGLARMTTPLHPTMDEAYLDAWCFYIPDRLWWNHAKEFYGENKDASFNPDGEYVMPYLKPSQYGVRNQGSVNAVGSLSDYFGFPIINYQNTVNNPTINNADFMRCTAGLHRCYQLVWNEFYRNSSVQPALQLNDGDTVSDAEWEVISKIRKVCKLPDYFTSALRSPQAGEDVLLPLGDWAPVVTRSDLTDTGTSQPSLKLGQYIVNPDNYGSNGDWDFSPTTQNLVAAADNGDLRNDSSSFLDAGSGVYSPANLWANLTSATATTINNLRAAVTVQQLLEIDAIGGKRYQQLLKAHFGVLTPDATLQRPELLGASRTPIGMRQVLQTSATTTGSFAGMEVSTTPQGNAAAVSVTNVANEWLCNKSFTEPGFIMVLVAVRPLHSYSQGIDCLLQKLNRYDHYYPVFDNLGNQPIYSRELYGSVYHTDDPVEHYDTVFGYKEAWNEYRIRSNRVSGLMRPNVINSLRSWNYSSYFDTDEVPVLNSAFVEEDENLIERTIAVQNQPQFLLDNYFEYTDIKNMSVHSTPGLTRL